MGGGDGLWRGSQKFSLHRTDSTTHVLMDAINKDSISSYYNLLEFTRKEHNLEDCPGQIYNMDETGMPLDPNIVTRSRQKSLLPKIW